MNAYTLSISHQELIALVKHHTACARRVPKALGAALMKDRSMPFFAPARHVKALQEEAKVVLNEHTTRAKELLALLKP